MKKSELKSLIREEVKKLLKESNEDTFKIKLLTNIYSIDKKMKDEEDDIHYDLTVYGTFGNTITDAQLKNSGYDPENLGPLEKYIKLILKTGSIVEAKYVNPIAKKNVIFYIDNKLVDRCQLMPKQYAIDDSGVNDNEEGQIKIKMKTNIYLIDDEMKRYMQDEYESIQSVSHAADLITSEELIKAGFDPKRLGKIKKYLQQFHKQGDIITVDWDGKEVEDDYGNNLEKFWYTKI
jgi:hypothetical protein